MTPFEEELKKALARREPSPDFALCVLERAGAGQAATEDRAAARRKSWFIGWWAGYRTVAALVVLLCVLTSGVAYRRHLEIAKGQAAKKQLLAAMHIAGEQLRQAQLRVRRIESPEVVMQ